MDVSNVGPRESRKRMAVGLVTFALAVGIAVLLSFLRVERSWRLFLFILFWTGALGLFQAWEKT